MILDLSLPGRGIRNRRGKMPKNKLHVFHNGIEWWIAESIDNLESVMREVGDLFYFDPTNQDEWKMLPDGEEITIIRDPYLNEGLWVRDIKTAEEWARERGPGFLASMER